MENNTWVRGNTRFISTVEHDIMFNMFNTRNKSGIISKHRGYFFVYYINYRFFTNIKRPEAMIGDCLKTISFSEPAIPWEGNGGSGIIRDRHTKNCMSPVLHMR